MMDINFNNLRKQTCWTYDKLARRLNANINSDWSEKEVRVNVSEIQDIMDELRGLIMTSAWTCDPNNPDFKMVGDEVGDITWFNSDSN